MASTVVRWLSHEFTVYEHSADWNEVPGLYIFAELLSGAEEWIAHYIGQTDSLRTRLPTHEDWPVAEQLGATHVHVNGRAGGDAAGSN